MLYSLMTGNTGYSYIQRQSHLWHFYLTAINDIKLGGRGNQQLPPKRTEQKWDPNGSCLSLDLWKVSHPCWLKKKCTAWELWVKFYVGQNEDYSPGDSISESSEKLLQRSRGECQYIWNSGEGEVHAIRHLFFFFLQVSASHEEQMSPWRILVLF